MIFLKYAIAWPVARTLYWSGDFICKFLDGYITVAEAVDALNESQDDPRIDELYHMYSSLMNWSILVDDWGVTNLWVVPEESTPSDQEWRDVLETEEYLYDYE